MHLVIVLLGNFVVQCPLQLFLLWRIPSSVPPTGGSESPHSNTATASLIFGETSSRSSAASSWGHGNRHGNPTCDLLPTKWIYQDDQVIVDHCSCSSLHSRYSRLLDAKRSSELQKQGRYPRCWDNSSFNHQVHQLNQLLNQLNFSLTSA